MDSRGEKSKALSQVSQLSGKESHGLLDNLSMPEELVRGSIVGEKYELINRIGRGGMGEVWKAKTQFAVFAIKFILPEYLSNTVITQRFDRELQILVSCQFDHVVPFVDYLVDPRFGRCIVMQHIQGHSLQWHLNQRQSFRKSEDSYPLFGDEELLKWSEQLGRSLATIHEHGFLHRDIKPGNILIGDSSKCAYWVDFGLAKSVEQKRIVTRPGYQPGTPAYMAPEQLIGQSASKASEQWSFAATFFALLVGSPPPKRISEDRERHSRITQQLGRFFIPLMRGLEPDPAKRFSSIAELTDAMLNSSQLQRKIKVPPMLIHRRIQIDHHHTTKNFRQLLCSRSEDLEHVHRVDINNSEIEDNDLELLLRALPSLQVLNIDNCSKLTDASLHCLEETKGFRTLIVRSCSAFDSRRLPAKIAEKFKGSHSSSKKGTT